MYTRLRLTVVTIPPLVTTSIGYVARHEMFKGQRRMDPVQIAEQSAISFRNVTAGADLLGDLLDLAEVPEEQLEELEAAATAAISDLSRIRQRVRQAGGAVVMKACEVCSSPMSGRSDRRYCSGTCRQAAHRARKLAAR